MTDGSQGVAGPGVGWDGRGADKVELHLLVFSHVSLIRFCICAYLNILLDFEIGFVIN